MPTYENLSDHKVGVELWLIVALWLIVFNAWLESSYGVAGAIRRDEALAEFTPICLPV